MVFDFEFTFSSLIFVIDASMSIAMIQRLWTLTLPGYVFAPVIGLLEELGYVEGVDLIAASYDWRFAPSALEKRDGYFSQLIRSIETVDRSERGVVLLAHSMGNKVAWNGSYFSLFVFGFGFTF